MDSAKVPALIAGRYELIEPIGQGGAATVWKARDRVDGAEVALKWLRVDHPDAVRAARAEVATLRMLRVPGVVTLRDEGLADGHAWVVMERVKGHPFPGRAGRCAWPSLEAPLVSLLETLERVHALGVTHRDLKPANVLVQDERAVLIDFGIARLQMSEHSGSPEGDPLYGTVEYMAPEAWSGEDDARSDLYSVGVMVYEALTGAFPFPVEGEVGALLAQRRHAPPNLCWNDALAPQPVFDVVARMLSPRPDERPQSARAVLNALGAAGTLATTRRRQLALAERRVWTPEELTDLFRGPNRLLHLRDDAARLLYDRTQGDAARIADELGRWERAGFARRIGGAYLVDRAALDPQMFGPLAAYTERVDTPSRRTATDPDDLDAVDLLDWLSLAACPLSVAELSRAMRWPPEQVATTLDGLALSGHITRDTQGRCTLSTTRAPPRWPPGRRVAALACLAAARELGAPGRLLHVLLGRCEADDILGEVTLAARSLAVCGHLTAAEHVLRQGLRVLQTGRDMEGAHVIALLEHWVPVAFEQRSDRALDRLLWELPPLRRLDPRIAHVEQLLRAELATLHATGQAAELVAQVPPFREPALELARVEVCVEAALHVSKDALRAVLRAYLVRTPPSARNRRRLASWLARLAYVRGCYGAAARLRMRAAREEPWASRRARESLRAAVTWLEDAEFGRASACAARVLRELDSLRLPTLEGDATWTQRTIAWRSGLDDEPDDELAEAAQHIAPRIGRLVLFHEAMLAWKCHDTQRFERFYKLAMKVEGQASEPRTRALLEGMRVDLGLAALDHDDMARRVAELTTLVPGIALQVMALTHGDRPADDATYAIALKHAGSVPRSQWHLRLDVLSVLESLARLGVPVSR